MNAPITLSLRDRNDRLRTTFIGGRVLHTAGIAELAVEDQIRVFHAVQHHNAFTEENDPHGEHDFGVIELPGIPTVFWKIDYYNRDLSMGSENPEDPNVTSYVLTIYLASEH